jgi:hypothetical protein
LMDRSVDRSGSEKKGSDSHRQGKLEQYNPVLL